MGVLELVTLPARLTVAATEATLGVAHLVAPDGPVRRPGGYAERLMLVIGEGGLVDRLNAALSDPKGPMLLVNTMAAAMAEQRPLGRALARDGALDRLLVEDGFVDKLVAEGGTLDQLVALGATLEQILPRLATLEDLLPRLATLDQILPKLSELGEVIPQLHESVDTLSAAVGPLGELAGRLPRSRRRAPTDA